MTFQTSFVPGTPRLAYDHSGEGPPVVFIHGIGGNKSNWHRQMAALAERFSVHAWDARGYHESDDYEGPLAFEDFPMTSTAFWIISVLKKHICLVCPWAHGS